MVASGEGHGEGIVREFGIDMYTLPYLKWITNKDLLYSTRNSSQCYVSAQMGREFWREWIHVYVWLSLFVVHLKLTTLLICYTPIQNKKRKLGCKLKLSRLPTDPTISSSVCFFISERRSSTQWEIKRFLCSRFRDVFLRNVLVNSYT